MTIPESYDHVDSSPAPDDRARLPPVPAGADTEPPPQTGYV